MLPNTGRECGNARVDTLGRHRFPLAPDEKETTDLPSGGAKPPPSGGRHQIGMADLRRNRGQTGFGLACNFEQIVW